MLSSQPPKTTYSPWEREKVKVTGASEHRGALAAHTVLIMGIFQLRTQYTLEDSITPHCVVGRVVRMTC